MTQVVVYSRYSPRPNHSDREREEFAAAEDAQTLVLQAEVCARYCEMKRLVVTETIKDVETSARKTKLFERTGGARLRDLPSGSHVVASTLDRMFRDVVDGLHTMEFFEKLGIRLHFADQGGNSLDVSTADGKFLVTVLLGVAAREPHRTAERTAAAYAHRSKNGQRMSAPDKIPFGKCVSPNDADRLVDSPAELEIIEEVRKLRAAGSGLRAICRAMEGRELRGTKWHPETIRRLLRRAG